MTGDGWDTARIPPPFGDGRLDHHVEVRWPHTLLPSRVSYTPAGGAADPLVYFVSARHTADLDADDALLDIFDVAYVLRHLAWGAPLRAEAKLDRDRDGDITGERRACPVAFRVAIDRWRSAADRSGARRRVDAGNRSTAVRRR